MPDLALPQNLSRESLVQIVTGIQDLLYYDVDDEDREFWNPEKIWNAGDVCQRIGETLQEYNLVPEVEVFHDPESNRLPSLIELAHRVGLASGALDDLVHECASVTASAVNNEGLDGQIPFLLEQLGEAELRARLAEIAEPLQSQPN